MLAGITNQLMRSSRGKPRGASGVFFIRPQPLDFEIGRVVLGIGLTDPVAADLHREDQVKRLLEGPPLGIFSRDARVGQGALTIDDECDLVRLLLDTIVIPRVAADRRGHAERVGLSGQN